MRMYDIIYKKRMAEPLSRQEIDFVIDGFVNGSIPDYQMSALAMAICFNGMSKEETFYLTDAMMRSGDVVNLDRFEGLCVDKHSTGGVGDKTTLVIAPIVASLGVKVAKMSGRGLGFTGGTIDKLESIKGFKTELDGEDFFSQVEKIGVSVIGQSGNLVPADKKLYALRDVTATVDSIPLIASSIMSKKLASGAHSIVLDVKCGSGAFMKDEKTAIALAKAMIEIGQSFSRNVCALITNMDKPLGVAIGNSLEVYEAIQILSCKGDDELFELCVELSSNMTSMALQISVEKARDMVLDAIKSGKALAKLEEWIVAQGGENEAIKNPEILLKAEYKKEYKAKKTGYICKMNAEQMGISSMLLGAGRRTKEDKIDHLSGIMLNKKLGDFVNEGDTIATLYTSTECLLKDAEKSLDFAIEYSGEKPIKKPLIIKVLKAD